MAKHKKRTLRVGRILVLLLVVGFLGLPGLILQWVILPLLVFRVTQRDAHES